MNNPKCCKAVAGGAANLGLPVRINGTERQGRDCRKVTKAKSPGLGVKGLSKLQILRHEPPRHSEIV
jgi:hypothetical protein